MMSLDPTQTVVSDSSSLKGNDSPNMFLVLTLLTGNDNYLQWKFSIQLALGAKKKLGFIDGTNEKPSTGESDIADWISTDCMVRSWLLNSISKDISGAFIFATTAKELWNELGDHFGESNGPLIYQLQRQIASITQGNSSLSKYYMNLKQLWDELNCLVPLPPCNCGSEKSISENISMTRLMQFLMGLNDTYDNLRNQILVLDPLPTVHKAYSMALRVEKQREVQINFAAPIEISAMFVKSSSSNSGFKKQNPTQFKGKQDYKQKNQSDRYCNFCKITGHTRESCFKLNGYPDWYKELKDKKKSNFNSAHLVDGNYPGLQESPINAETEHISNEMETNGSFNSLMKQFSQFLKTNKNVDPHTANFTHLGDFVGMKLDFSLLNSLRSDMMDKDSWILDTGATAHMCNNLESSNTYKELLKFTPIFLPDGSIKAVTHKGYVNLSSRLVLENTLHVPDFKCNLLSVRALATSAKIEFIFRTDHCILQDPLTNEIVARGKVIGNLYILDKESISKKSCNSSSFLCNFVVSKNKDSYVIWHYRLGHSSESVLNKLDFVSLKSKDDINPCISCHQAKQHRLPFAPSVSKSTNIFELVHMDLWGPYKTKTITGDHYFLTILDDCSRATWTFLMNDKVQTFITISNFLAYVKNHFQTTIKFIRTDNGFEFVNNKCQQLFHSSGIIHQKTTSYTPQQNGRVERKHQHLLQVARYLLFQSNMPIKFWEHAILIATYIINMLPTSILDWKTPSSVLYKKEPSYSNIKVFGCLCFAANTIPHKTKFESRASICCFIGYNQGQKAYKLYDLNEKKGHNVKRCYLL